MEVSRDNNAIDTRRERKFYEIAAHDRNVSFSVRHWITVAFTILLITLAVVIFQPILRTTGKPIRVPEHDNCGTDPATARSRDCHFDILSFAWQTPQCFDRETSEAFRTHNGTWSYFSDFQGTTPRSEAEAMSGESTTFTTVDFHRVHCTYMWRQLHRAYAVLGYIDEHLANWNHTLHCQQVLLLEQEKSDREEVRTVGQVIYPRCRKL
jgi:hypothetical protein